LIEQQVQSGQSAAAFCREQGILAKSFYRWRGLLEKSTEEAFVCVEPLPAVTTSITDRMVLEYRVMVTNCDQRDSLRKARPVWCCFASVSNSCLGISFSSCENTVLW
jgi:hypothetical protein